MIVDRKKLSFWERLYLPAVLGGFSVTLRHFFRKKVTMQYPEQKWTVPEGYRGAPYLVRDQNGRVQPPKNSVTIMPADASMAAYSPIGNMANFIELYSTL